MRVAPRNALALILSASMLSGCSGSPKQITRETKTPDELPTEVAAQLTSVATGRDSLPQYLLDLAIALGHAHSAGTRQSSTEISSDLPGFDKMLRYKKATADFGLAEAQVTPYTNSSDERIRESAQGLATAFGTLASLSEQTVAHTKDLLNATPETFKEGDATERMAELAAGYAEAWSLVVPSVIMATHAAVELDSTTGLVSRLALSADQRNQVVQTLERSFGKAIRGGIRREQTALVGSAAFLYEMLADPRWSLSDSTSASSDVP